VEAARRGALVIFRRSPDPIWTRADFELVRGDIRKSSVPGTRAADGDPLDVLVLGLPPTFPGCLITARVFEMFAQVKSTRDRAEGGLGIGLALAKGLVELQGVQSKHEVRV
jgi:Inorganic pyrophosphatase